MARNEEKQLARLNRFYLQQHKEEELQKRPPRPRLETLSSLDDVKKWIPSILKDIDFYVKQMEVSCYPTKTIEEFEKRISQLRGEYKAFVRKAHELEPDLSATPWSDRPYSSKRQKLNTDKLNLEPERVKQLPTSTETAECKRQLGATSFIPLATPLLLGRKSHPEFYGNRQSEYRLKPEEDIASQDQPLDFNFIKSNKAIVTDPLSIQSPFTIDGSKSNVCKDSLGSFGIDTSKSRHDSETKIYIGSKNEILGGAQAAYHVAPVNQSLNLPYTDSSSDEET